MALGIGTDIIEIHRIRETIRRHQHHFLDRVFTFREQEYCFKYTDSTPHFAGRFAAKEAISKALGKGVSPELNWLDIEIGHDELKKPIVLFSLKAQELFNSPKVLISISHCREYATATAILI